MHLYIMHAAAALVVAATHVLGAAAFGPASVCVSAGGATPITVCVDKTTGSLVKVGTHPMLPGSGTALTGCSRGAVSVAQPNTTTIMVDSVFSCPQQAGCQSNRGDTATCTVKVLDIFSASPATNSVRWSMTATSSSAALFTADVVAALGYADWDLSNSSSTTAWLGGPTSNTAPSTATLLPPTYSNVIVHDRSQPWA